MFTGYNQKNNKKGFKKQFMEDIKIFLKKKKTKSNNIVMRNIKIPQKMENKGWLGIEKNIIKYVKTKPVHK